MANRDGQPVAGVGTEYEAQSRHVSKGREQYLIGGCVVDGSESRDPLNTSYIDRLRAGVLLGQITATNKYSPSIIGVTSAAYDASASDNTTLTVSAATATEIVRRCGSTGTLTLTGPPTAAGTVAQQTVTYSAVNTTTGAVTISALSYDAISGSFVGDTDGSQNPLLVLGDGYPVKVTDAEGTSQDTSVANVLVGGSLDSSQIVNWPSNAVLRTWLMDQLAQNGGGQFTFDHLYE